MEKCPIEICHQIFRAACVDGGKTGIALSLVSRYVNQMSREVKYHSVTVIGLDQIMTFAKVLKDLPPRYRVVRHLFLSSMPQKTDPNDDITPTLNQEIGQVGAEKHYVSFFGEDYTHLSFFADYHIIILRRVSATLSVSSWNCQRPLFCHFTWYLVFPEPSTCSQFLCPCWWSSLSMVHFLQCQKPS